MTFEQYVDDWQQLVKQIDSLKAQLKPLAEREMAMRRSIVESVDKTAPLAEGVNRFPLADGRKLKIENTLQRTIDADAMGAARDAYMALNNRPGSFDDLIRTKYELDKRAFDKVTSEEAKRILSRMLVTKPAAPVVQLEA